MAAILVVEDDEDNAALVTRFLRRAGHRVSRGVDGETGVRAALKDVPDLILMDLDLPVMDGWEASKQIRANPITAHIPIIALTAHSLSDQVRKARLAGCDAYETKPVVYERLMKKIEAFVHR